jgi:hypothetical protein
MGVDGTLAADFGVVFEAVVLGHGYGELGVLRDGDQSRMSGKLGAAEDTGNAKKPILVKISIA